MKKILYVLLGAIILIGVSCNDSANPQQDSNASSPDTTTINKDTIAKRYNELGELYVKCNGLEDSIMSLNEKIIDVHNELNVVKREKADVSKMYLLLVMSCIVCVIIILLFWTLLRRRINDVKIDINNLKRSDKTRSNIQNFNTSKIWSKSDIEKIVSEKTSILQKQIEALISQNSILKNNEEQQQIKVQSKENKSIGYWGVNSKDDFINEYSSLRDECFFKVEYISDNKAIFYPISKDKLFGGEIKFAVEMTGCPLEEARKMEVKFPGEASLKHSPDGRRYWHIEKKALVLLTK